MAPSAPCPGVELKVRILTKVILAMSLSVKQVKRSVLLRFCPQFLEQPWEKASHPSPMSRKKTRVDPAQTSEKSSETLQGERLGLRLTCQKPAVPLPRAQNKPVMTSEGKAGP